MFRILRVSSLLLAALLTSVASFGAQGSQRIATAIANVGSNARILANAQITVCSYNVSHPDCSAPITVYEDPALTIPYPTTPFRADGNGNYSYWVAAGNYVEQVCATGAQCTLQVITLGGPGGGGTVTPCGTVGQIQIADTGGSNLNCDPNFFIDPTGHTFNSTANMVINAVSSLPRATYDPMDGNRDGGLAAAIAGTSGFTPTQVLQATIDYGECQILMSKTVFTGEKIPLPAKVTMNIGQVLLWTNTDFGGDNQGSVGTYPLLQHNDATKVMVAFHAAGDTITCSNGTTYNPIPGGASGGYIHDFVISGMGAVSTTTDIGIETNGDSTVVRNIIGGGQIFGGPAIYSPGTSNFLQQLGYPNGNIQGCKTYTSGTLPVSDFGVDCGSIMSVSLDGGAENLYATDGQAFSSGHARGPCYPHCAAIVAGNSGGYLNDAFAQVSDIDYLFDGTATRANNLRGDFTSGEAVRIAGTGNTKISQLAIDSSCTDTSLQAAFNAGTATGCAALVDTSTGGADQTTGVTVVNNSGILAPSFNQCFIEDTRTGFSGTSDTFSQITYQGAPNNTTANSLAFCGAFDGAQASGRVIFPSMSPIQATGSTINANGITSVILNGQTVSSIVGGIGNQPLFVTGPGILQNGSSLGTNNIVNLSGLNVTLAGGQTVEYIQTIGFSNGNRWQMIAGPPNQTPTHVNYAGNATPSNPSLLDVYGNAQARQVPGFTLFVNQIHGPTAGTGQACFEEQALFSDGSNVVSPLACTTVDLSAQTPGEVFAVVIPQATPVLYLVSNTEGNGVATGKYPAPAIGGGNTFWDGPTTIAAGGDGSTPPPASENNTGSAILAFGIYGPATAPSGTCTAGQGGALVLSQDGHATFCPVGGGTWATKF